MASESIESRTGYTRPGGTPLETETRDESPSRRRVQGRAKRISGSVNAALERVSDEQLRQTFGWLSIGLGLAALLAPRGVGELTGIGARTGLLRAIGLRELAAGAGILGARDPSPWLWSRVAGDAMDLMVLGASSVNPVGRGRLRSAVSMAVVGSIAAADVVASRRLSSPASRSPQECYDYWRRLSNAPKFMSMIESVSELDDKRSRWVAKVAGVGTVEWESILTEDRAGERIAWHSGRDSPLLHAGVVSFTPAPGGRGTVVHLTVHYRPPVAGIGAKLAGVTAPAPAVVLREDLRRFKQILEAGEIATTRGQPSGPRSLFARLAHVGRGS
jgi:uncharacterized membrane protein